MSKGSFEFELPPEEEGGIAPPPVPQTDGSMPELPPYPARSTAKVRSSGTFEFQLPEDADAPDARPIEETPSVPVRPIKSGSGEISLDPPSSSSRSGSGVFDLGSTPNLSDVLKGDPASGMIPPVPGGSSGDIDLGTNLPSLSDGSLQSAPGSSFKLGSNVFDLPEMSDLSDEPTSLSREVPVGDPVSGVLPPITGDSSGSFVLPGMAAPIPPPSASDSGPALGNLELISPVAPASDWIDSDGTETMEASEPVAPKKPLPPTEGSDIFAGTPVQPALPVDPSDILAAPRNDGAAPGDSTTQPSDVALSFDRPPGGSTMDDGASGDLPLAEEMVEDSSTSLLSQPRRDDESIHDMDEPVAGGLFDSARLAEAPDLPATAPPDSADYGSSTDQTQDASSILSDLLEPHPRPGGGLDSSSVRIEAPGMDRTLTDDGGNPAFDLTVPDEPAPPGLFDEAPDATVSEAVDWDSASNSDLFSGSRTAPEVEPGGDEARESDADLTAKEPSLDTSPSSIFSEGDVPGTDLSDVTEDARAAADDAVEFADYPKAGLSDSDERRDMLEPPAAPRRPRTPSSTEFDMPQPAASGGDTDVESISDILRKRKPADEEDPSEVPTRAARPLTGDPSQPAVTVDWMAGSSEEQAVMPETKAKPAGKPKAPAPAPEKAKPAKPAAKPEKRALVETGEKPEKTTPKPVKMGAGGMLGGLVVGMVVAGGAWAGLYFSGAIPNSEKTTQAPMPPPGPPPMPGMPPGGFPPPGVTTPDAAFAAGDTGRALELIKANAPTTTSDKAAAGHVRVFAKIQELAKSNATAAANDADLKEARVELAAVIADAEARKDAAGKKRAVKAAVDLGVSYEIAGENAKARQVYSDAVQMFPEYSATFEALINRLDAVQAAPGTSFHIAPADAERLLFAVAILLQEEPKTDDPEAGVFYWKAVNAAAGGKYADAIDQIDKAKAAHVKRAKAMAGRGLNPLSDPLEQIFPRACDDLKQYWTLRGALYGNPAIAEAIKKDGVPKTLDALAKAGGELATAKADLVKTQKEADVAKADAAKFDKEAKAAKKDALDAKDMVNTLLKDLVAAKDKEAKLDKELKVVKDMAATLDKDAKALLLDKNAAEKKLAETVKDLKDRDALITSLAAELKGIKALPDKWTPAELLAAQKSVAARVTGPDLKDLVNPAVVGMVGGPLAVGQLLSLSERLSKTDAAVKAANEKLATETKRLNDAHAVDLKKASDAYAADAKKLKDAHAVDTKKLTDKFALDAKKLTDDHNVALKKATEGLEAKVKAAEVVAALEKARAAALAEKVKIDLANVITPAQAIDVWLPLLAEMRRPADADPGLNIAKKSLASAPPGSEDAAKAHTLTGMAHLVKGNLREAKAAFETAQRTPAYKEAEGKFWVKVVDQGLDAVDDPLAIYRQPVKLPLTDARAAAKSLDAGIAAFKAGMFAEAATALADAARNDPTDPVAWYFLGAARWRQGETKQAEADFRQGAEREKVSPTPSREVSAMLSPIQGTARDALDKARP